MRTQLAAPAVGELLQQRVLGLPPAASLRWRQRRLDLDAPAAGPDRKHVVHVIFAADVSGSLEDVSSTDTSIGNHRAFRLAELDGISLHPPIQRFLQRWQPGDPAVYLGEMWVP